VFNQIDIFKVKTYNRNMTDKKLTNEQATKLGQVMLKVMDYGLSLPGDDHLDIKFALDEDDRLNEVQNLKIKIVKDMIGFYHKYPTLHSISFTYYEQSFGYAHAGWNSSISQVAWDTVENIKNTQEFKDSKLNIHAFCNNKMIDKKDLDVIPFGDNQFTNSKALKEELKAHFNYLVENPELSLILRNQINKQVLEKNQDYGKNRIGIESRNWYGWKNIKIEDDIKEFFGKEMMSELLYLGLEDKINVKTEDKPIKKMKI
jgi:hypothetical protein